MTERKTVIFDGFEQLVFAKKCQVEHCYGLIYNNFPCQSKWCKNGVCDVVREERICSTLGLGGTERCPKQTTDSLGNIQFPKINCDESELYLMNIIEPEKVELYPDEIIIHYDDEKVQGFSLFSFGSEIYFERLYSTHKERRL